MKEIEQLIIWAVDDNKGDLILFEETLVQLGYRSKHIRFFHNIKELGVAFQSENPDILFLDLFLLDSKGIETFERVKQLNPTCPIVVLSGVSDMDTAIRTVKLGAQDFLIKDEMTAEGIFRMISYSTERYRIISSLKESEEKYKALFQSIPIGTIVLNVEFQILEANEHAHQILNRNNLLGIPYLSLLNGIGKAKIIEEALINCTSTILKQSDMNETIYLEQNSSKLTIGDEVRYIVSLIDRTDKIVREIKKNEIIHHTLDQERLRISQELHDGIGQYLVAIQLNLELLKGVHTSLDESIENIQDMTKTSINLARSMSYNLSPPDLDKGLLYAVKTLFRQLQNVKNIQFDLTNTKLNKSPFNKNDEYNIFRIIQEFVNNSIKYSTCDLISCSMQFEEDLARIELHDNGKGFDLTSSSQGLGMRTMKERALASDLEFDLTSTPGDGTTLKLFYSRAF